MSISFTKYIDITSVVGGASQVPQRLWCGRVFTTDTRVGPNAVLQFSSAADVADFFGSSSEEYNRSLTYFTYNSPLGTKAAAIQFARWVSADSPARDFGAPNIAVLSTLQAITAGKLSLKFGNTVTNLTAINLSSASSLTAVATAIQTALRATSAVELTTCTVTWDATRQAFNFVASPTGVVTESFDVVVPTGATSANDIALAMGLYEGQGAVLTDAQVAEAPVDAFNRVTALTNNCGSFCFTRAAALGLSDVTAIGLANAALNVMFIFRVHVEETTYATWAAALDGVEGLGLEYESVTISPQQYVEMLPMAIQAAINFNAVNSVVGFMYKQNSILTPSVTTDTLSDTLDNLRVNYYGQTQTAGQNISFYQRGTLCGGATAPVDSAVFANEQWFKDLVGSLLMNAQLSLGRIPANKRGQAIVELNLQNAANDAVNNGAISVNGTLTITQQIYITQQTNDPTAWHQVQNLGYWYSTQIVSTVVSSGVTEYSIEYTFIYRKDDQIKKIEGSHQLI